MHIAFARIVADYAVDHYFRILLAIGGCHRMERAVVLVSSLAENQPFLPRNLLAVCVGDGGR